MTDAGRNDEAVVDDGAEGPDEAGSSSVPAPWRLSGHGYCLLYRLPRTVLDGEGALSEGLEDRFVGGTSALLVAEYERSDVGPHRELLFVPGRFRRGETSFYSISQGFVSSSAPAARGLENWGLPRQVADIAFERSGTDERVTVRREGRSLAAFTFRTGRFGLPATTDVVPSTSRTIMQARGGRALFTTVGGRGTIKQARLLDATFDSDVLPDLSGCEPRMTVRLEAFHLVLPRPRVVDLTPSSR